MENSNSLQKKLIPIFAGVLVIGIALYFTQKKSITESTPEKVDSSVLTTSQSAHSAEVAPTISADSAESAPVLTDAQKKWQELQEIVHSKNDNDPRLDKDYKKMSEGLHALLREKYAEVPMEDRNQRGLIAFLIARDLKSHEDLEFLKKIYEESPCLSLENCKAKSQDEPHLAGIDQSSMNYPQLVSLYQLEKQMKENPNFFSDPKNKDTARGLLDQAAQFPVQGVKERATRLKNQYPL